MTLREFYNSAMAIAAPYREIIGDVKVNAGIWEELTEGEVTYNVCFYFKEGHEIHNVSASGNSCEAALAEITSRIIKLTTPKQEDTAIEEKEEVKP